MGGIVRVTILNHGKLQCRKYIIALDWARKLFKLWALLLLSHTADALPARGKSDGCQISAATLLHVPGLVSAFLR